MKQLTMLLLFIAFAIVCFSQNAKKLSDGNYEITSGFGGKIDTTKFTKEGHVAKSADGNEYTIYITKNDKKFIVRQSKRTGNLYRQYLKE